jgi:hypothetical protein
LIFLAIKSIESCPLPKKSVEKSMAKFIHGHRHNTDMEKNREKETIVRDRDTSGQGHKWTGTQTDRD